MQYKRLVMQRLINRKGEKQKDLTTHVKNSSKKLQMRTGKNTEIRGRQKAHLVNKKIEDLGITIYE